MTSPITSAYVRKMAGYNRWMNDAMYASAWPLDDAARKQDLGGFFSSIHGTFNHLLWGDQIWMSRFAGTPAPLSPDIAGSTRQFDDFARLRAERQSFDVIILQWAASLDDDWLDGNLSWHSGALGREVMRPRAELVMHMFNHQTHHRGQVHAMLTRLGVTTPTTDLFAMTR
ncbi:MAG: DinB family protein [Pseudomonadota bacterium]